MISAGEGPPACGSCARVSGVRAAILLGVKGGDSRVGRTREHFGSKGTQNGSANWHFFEVRDKLRIHMLTKIAILQESFREARRHSAVPARGAPRGLQRDGRQHPCGREDNGMQHALCIALQQGKPIAGDEYK